MIDRRSFIKSAAPLVVVLQSVTRGQLLVERGRFSAEDVPSAREMLLKLVNQERANTNLSRLVLDDLACRVAAEHALDMSKRQFLSHWGSDGRKPYHRYSFAGGVDAVQENVSSAENIQSVATDNVVRDLRDMHISMLLEVPPNDGHRRTILFPYHTHVGFGMALHDKALKLAELYLARYVRLDPFVNHSKPKSTVLLTGHLLNSRYFLHGVDVFYEPLPAPPEISWLQTPRSVSLPSIFVRQLPKAPPGTTYVDGGKGDFEWDRFGKFRVKVKLYRDEPGIYTIVFWIRRTPADKAFPGAQVCILSE
jgi:hypothetical protein